MEKLTGQTLEVKVPISAISKMGKPNGNEEIQDLFEVLFHQSESKYEDSQRKVMNEYLPYLSNNIFLPIVVSEMVQKNLTFTEVAKSSRPKVEEAIKEWTTKLSATEGSDIKFIRYCRNLTQHIGRIVREKSCGEHRQDNWKICVTLGDVSDEFSDSIVNSGVLKMAERIYNSVNKIYKERLIEPAKKATRNEIEKVKKKGIMSAENADFLTKDVESWFNQQGTVYQIGVILTFALEKAINEDITFFDAVYAVNEDDISEYSFKFFNISEKEAKRQIRSMSLMTKILPRFFSV